MHWTGTAGATDCQLLFLALSAFAADVWQMEAAMAAQTGTSIPATPGTTPAAQDARPAKRRRSLRQTTDLPRNPLTVA
eukprot:9175782-Heterocapsa_arctica.AAC.1